MRLRLFLSATASLGAVVLGLPGCGGGGEASDLATLAQPDTVVFVEGAIRPSGALKSNVDQAAETIGGIENLGDFVVEKLEEAAREDGEPFDFEAEVEPWLGEEAGVAFERVEADGDLSDPLIVVESTDGDATQRFIDSQAERSKDPYRNGSYDGIDYRIGGDRDQAVGVVGDFLVLADNERDFKAAVDASNGDSLADSDRFDSAISDATEGSFADIYVDVGAVLRQSGDEISEQALPILKGAGIDPSDATAVASVVPGRDQIRVDIASELGGEEAPSGDPSALLGSLPASSFAALAASGFDGQLREALDSLDASGIPGEVPPNQLKKSLKSVGIDVDLIAGSLGDAGLFAVGSSEADLGGALVLATEDPQQARTTVSSLGLLLRGAGTPGVSAVTGRASGFSIRDQENLGDKPLVVVTRGDRIAVGYGLPQTLLGLAAKRTLSDTAAFPEAAEALGDTPISGFVDGPAALRLANSLVPRTDEGYRDARPYLRKIRSVALGSRREGDLARAKLIISLRK